MSARLRGDKNQFWDAAAVGISGTSAIVDIGRSVDQITIFVTTNAATTVTVEVAHTGDVSSQGVLPEEDDSVWFPLYYVGGASILGLTFAGAGNGALIIPDIAVMHVRLRSSAAATITAGWLAGGE